MATADKIVDGLRILIAGSSRVDVSAEHDVIYAGGPTTTVNTEDRLELERLGWYWDEQFGCWAHFT